MPSDIRHYLTKCIDHLFASIPSTVVLWSTMETATLFDTLCPDTISVIVKQLRSVVSKHNRMVRHMRRPDKPEMFDPVRFLALLFSENSPLRSAAAMLVSSISLSDREENKMINLHANSLSIGPKLFEGEAREMQLGKNILSACGPYVRRIIVSSLPDEEAREVYWAEQFTEHMFQYCRNVEEIMLYYFHVPLIKWGTTSSLFREYATNLRKIYWGGLEVENLLLDLGNCVNIRCLHSYKLSPATLLKILKAAGSKLEELRLSDTPNGACMEIVEAIRNYCKNLNAMLIWNSKDVIDMVGQESYSSLICGYGPQLKHANTYGLDHEHLVEVVRVCTNLEVEEYLRGEGIEKWGHIYDMGPRVVRLDLCADLLYGDEYIGALEQCSNLRGLSLSGNSGDEITGVSDETIANVFSQCRFPQLERLSIHGFKSNQRNMGLIASSTTNLNSAYFSLFELDLVVDGFQLFVDSNRHLKCISIFHGGFREGVPSEESVLEWLSEVVKIFCKCQKLSITVSCSDDGVVKKEDLVRVCKVLPCRGVDVRVQLGDVKYQNN